MKFLNAENPTNTKATEAEKIESKSQETHASIEDKRVKEGIDDGLKLDADQWVKPRDDSKEIQNPTRESDKQDINQKDREKADPKEETADINPSDMFALYGCKEFAELPLAPQVPNGCGLATLLMNVNPEKYKEYKEFLDRVFDIVKQFLPFASKISVKEFRWAYVLQCLLLKAQAYGNWDFLYEFLNERMEYAFEDQRFVNQSMIEGYKQTMVQKRKVDYLERPLNQYLDQGLLNYVMVDNFIKVMKTDVELKILMEFFDYQFEYQNTGDLFGAVVFEANEVRKPGESVRTKLSLLKQKLKDPNYRIFFGVGHHWVAMTAVVDKNPTVDATKETSKARKEEKIDAKQVLFLINDPMTPRKSQIMLKNLSGSCRIYIFKRRNQGVSDIHKKIIETWASEVEKEVEIMKYIQEEQKKRLKKVQEEGIKKEKPKESEKEEEGLEKEKPKESEKEKEPKNKGKQEKEEDKAKEEQEAIEKGKEKGDAKNKEDPQKITIEMIPNANQPVPLKMKKKESENTQKEDEKAPNLNENKMMKNSETEK